MTSAAEQPQLATVGRIGAPYGVRGWLKVQSFTAPPEQLIHYQPWYLRQRGGLMPVTLVDHKWHSGNLVVALEGVDDRDQAKALGQLEIAVAVTQFPPLPAGEYYWHQLQGLAVTSHYQGQLFPLGKVVRLLETGANDVLVVKGNSRDPERPSIDNRERLIPYLPDQVILNIDLAAGITVDWDPAF